MPSPADQQTLYLYPFCLDVDITIKRPHCYCHNCERSFDINDAISYEPKDDA